MDLSVGSSVPAPAISREAALRASGFVPGVGVVDCHALAPLVDLFRSMLMKAAGKLPWASPDGPTRGPLHVIGNGFVIESCDLEKYNLIVKQNSMPMLFKRLGLYPEINDFLQYCFCTLLFRLR